MRAHPDPLAPPLDWPGLVDEARRRRRAEGLTQKEHAALAGVSIPTIISFDRKETSLSLGKAIDILRVVGLVNDRPELSAQDAFRQAADSRWEELAAGLPDGAAGRLPDGHTTFDYQIKGASASSPRALLAALGRADRKYTGWPPFWQPSRKAIAPYPYDGGIECWLGQADAERAFDDPAHADFWRAALDGRLYLRRGFQEDSVDHVKPATIFDLTLPIWRAGEILLHAAHLAEALDVGSETTIRCRVRLVGLAGRELKSWANPHRTLYEDHRCRTGHAESAVESTAGAIAGRLAELVRSLLAPVYELFDFFELPHALVEEELHRLTSTRTRRQ